MKASAFLSILFLLAAMGGAMATVTGNTGVQSPYFALWVKNNEVSPRDPQRDVSRVEHLDDIRATWRFGVQLFRAIGANSAAREALTRTPLPAGDSDIWFPQARKAMATALAPYGLTLAQIDRQPAYVYTLQLGAFSSREGLRPFLRAYPHEAGDHFNTGTRIYRDVQKDVRLQYGSEGTWKEDPLYLTSYRGVTRVRYGLYATPEDAARDAAAWRERFGVTPWVDRVPLTRGLVQQVLFGAVPGIFVP